VLTRELADPAATTALAGRLAALLAAAADGWIVTLSGPLGAGKTTFVRGFLRGLGYEGRVPSPTYTLVEPYTIDGRRIVHLDLYRLAHPEELEYLGFRDLLAEDATVLVEWPERAGGALDAADLEIELAVSGPGRTVRIRGATPRAAAIVRALRTGTR
jgi:tRNA threonylcarbamoyladenosine biosynthesis protein TsaE